MYIGFHFGGGGGSNYFLNSVGICRAESVVQRAQNHAFVRGFRGHASP